jgi:hypothetical protein
MTERPIIFNGEMVRAILDGRKTVTRRIVKMRSVDDHPAQARFKVMTLKNGKQGWLNCQPEHPYHITKMSPYGVFGDRLWVRENWRPHGDAPLSQCTGPDDISFMASADEAGLAIFKWRPSIHMPRWASRITLEVISVRCEPLFDITESDAMAEGVQPVLVPPDGGSCPYLEGFERLWHNIHGPGVWDKNPFVWRIEFKNVGVKRNNDESVEATGQAAEALRPYTGAMA